MSLPNYLSKIKSSGIYRFTWDKSVVPPQQAETLRLLVGYSEKGPFNSPVYIESLSDFKSIYGNISKRLERKGVYFHRMAEQALQAGPILALNIKPFTDNETVNYANFNGVAITDTKSLSSVSIKKLYDTNRFWTLDADKMIENIDNLANYVTLAATDTIDASCSVVMRKIKPESYTGITVRSWCATQGIEPTGYFAHILDQDLSEFFAEIYVFRGQFTDAMYGENGDFKKYMNENGQVLDSITNSLDQKVDALTMLANDPKSNFIGSYSGCLLPYFKDANGNYISLDLKFNADHTNHKMMMKFDSSLLEDASKEDDVLKYLGISKTQSTAKAQAEGEAEGEGTISGTTYKVVYFKGYQYSAIQNDSTIWAQCEKVLFDPGIYEALTNRVDIEYHYIVDTFDSDFKSGSVNSTSECKKTLFEIAKKKDNAFAIVNFPKIAKMGGITKDVMNSYKLEMPAEVEGASYGAYYTQLTFTDGTVKTVVPSAALVSNNFMDKWGARQPYYIVAGPNYGALSYSGLVGPDYNFGRSDLDILEPIGINAIVYVPRLGTYISSNQTAKQVPVSGLSKVHIRELIIYLQNEIENLLQSYQWEMNTQTLRDTIKAKADAICDKILNNGGIYAFINICDETNNTPEVIDNEMIILDTEIEPARGAGKMVHQLTIHKTGGLTSSVK